MYKGIPHDVDHYSWLVTNIKLLKEGKLDEVDMAGVINELEDIEMSADDQLTSRLIQLIGHLLKWQYQPTYVGKKSWKDTIEEQRDRINLLIKKNPSLKSKKDECLKDGYEYGRKLFARQTGLNIKGVPEDCPYTWEQIIDDEFYPEAEKEND